LRVDGEVNATQGACIQGQRLRRLRRRPAHRGLTRDHILDNLSLYWLTGTVPRRPGPTGRADEPKRSPPVGFTTFPDEIFAYFNEAERGGHFAAWEEPQLFSEEIRAAFRTLR
jgi:hypothetical protein